MHSWLDLEPGYVSDLCALPEPVGGGYCGGGANFAHTPGNPLPHKIQ